MIRILTVLLPGAGPAAFVSNWINCCLAGRARELKMES